MGRNNGYTAGRAHIPSWPAGDKTACAMAAPTNMRPRLLRIDLQDWQRDPDFSRGDDVLFATAHLSDGTKVERQARIVYRLGQRERILEAVLNLDPEFQPSRQMVEEIVGLQKQRWTIKQDLLRSLQMELAR